MRKDETAASSASRREHLALGISGREEMNSEVRHHEAPGQWRGGHFPGPRGRGAGPAGRGGVPHPAVDPVTWAPTRVSHRAGHRGFVLTLSAAPASCGRTAAGNSQGVWLRARDRAEDRKGERARPAAAKGDRVSGDRGARRTASSSHELADSHIFPREPGLLLNYLQSTWNLCHIRNAS